MCRSRNRIYALAQDTHGILDFVGLRQPGAKADSGHLGAVGESDGFSERHGDTQEGELEGWGGFVSGVMGKRSGSRSGGGRARSWL